jgi:hypothetical protein
MAVTFVSSSQFQVMKLFLINKMIIFSILALYASLPTSPGLDKISKNIIKQAGRNAEEMAVVASASERQLANHANLSPIKPITSNHLTSPVKESSPPNELFHSAKQSPDSPSNGEDLLELFYSAKSDKLFAGLPSFAAKSQERNPHEHLSAKIPNSASNVIKEASHLPLAREELPIPRPILKPRHPAVDISLSGPVKDAIEDVNAIPPISALVSMKLNPSALPFIPSQGSRRVLPTHSVPFQNLPTGSRNELPAKPAQEFHNSLYMPSLPTRKVEKIPNLHKPLKPRIEPFLSDVGAGYIPASSPLEMYQNPRLYHQDLELNARYYFELLDAAKNRITKS